MEPYEIKPLFLPKVIRNENSLMNEEYIVATILDYNGGIHYLNETALRILQLCDGNHSIEEIINIIDEEYTGSRWSKVIGVYKTLVEGLRRGFVAIRSEGLAARPRVLGSPPDKPLLNFLHAPAQVLLELTHKCNLRCRHCYLPRRLAEELTLEELLELAHQLVEAGVLQVSIGGGEPLLRFAELVELVKVLVSNGVDVVLATNGTLFGEEEARELRRAGLRTVQFSLDGVGATHDAIRGVAGCFERVVEAVKLAKSMGFKVLVKTVAQRGNVGQLPELFKLLNKLGVDGWGVSRAVPSGRALISRFDVNVSFQEFSEAMKQVKEIADKYIGVINVVVEDTLKPFEHLSSANLEYAVCPAGTTSLHVDPNGDVKPCSYFPPQFVCGNLRKSRLLEVWFRSPLLNELRMLRRSDLWEPCRSCRLACNGRCRGSAAAFFGDPRAPDPLCPLVEKTFIEGVPGSEGAR
jgi:radical SAM protein with 4Fe4S-binding SPASM domain